MLKIGHWEGISYLLLLGIAMPLKYIFDFPLAVRFVGMAHGLLFTAFIGYLFYMLLEQKIVFKHLVIGFLLSLVPFGTFYLKKYIPEYYESRDR